MEKRSTMNASTVPDPKSAQIAAIHTSGIPEAFSVLSSGPAGLSQDEATKRLQSHGPNVITKVKGKPLWRKFLANFTHLMAILLWVGGIVGFLAQLPQIGIAIWMVNIINGAFSFWQEFKAEKATEALRKLLPSYARALRDGEVQRILAEELVPGDVILLEEGDRISSRCAPGRRERAARRPVYPQRGITSGAQDQRRRPNGGPDSR